MRNITVKFPGNKKVEAVFDGFSVITDQRLDHGGDQSAPSPFDLFFVSMATCAGISALDYCQKHHIPTEGLLISLRAHRHPVQPRYDRIVIELTPPAGLAARQLDAIISEIETCSLKRHILTPPSFEIVTLPPASR